MSSKKPKIVKDSLNNITNTNSNLPSVGFPLARDETEDTFLGGGVPRDFTLNNPSNVNMNFDFNIHSGDNTIMEPTGAGFMTTSATTNKAKTFGNVTNQKRKHDEIYNNNGDDDDDDDDDYDGFEEHGKEGRKKEKGTGQDPDNKTRDQRIRLARFYASQNTADLNPNKKSRGAEGSKNRNRLPAWAKDRASESLKIKKEEFKAFLTFYKRLAKTKSSESNKKNRDTGVIDLQHIYEKLVRRNETDGFVQVDRRRGARSSKQKEPKYWEVKIEKRCVIEGYRQREIKDEYFHPVFDDLKDVAAPCGGSFHHLYFSKLRHILDDIRSRDREPERFRRFYEDYFPTGEGPDKNRDYDTVEDLEQDLELMNPFYSFDPIPHPLAPDNSMLSLGNYGIPIALFVDYNNPDTSTLSHTENYKDRKFSGTYGRSNRWKDELGNAYVKHLRRLEKDFGGEEDFYLINRIEGGDYSSYHRNSERVVVSTERKKYLKSNHSICRGFGGGDQVSLLIPTYLFAGNGHIVRDDSESSNGSHYLLRRSEMIKEKESQKLTSKKEQGGDSHDSSESGNSNNSDLKVQTLRGNLPKVDKFILTPALFDEKKGVTIYSLTSLMVPPVIMGKVDFQTLWDHSFYPYQEQTTMHRFDFLSQFAFDEEVKKAIDHLTLASVNDNVSRVDYIKMMQWWSQFSGQNSYENLVTFVNSLHDNDSNKVFFYFSSHFATLGSVKIDNQALFALRPASQRELNPTGITLEVYFRGKQLKYQFSVSFKDDNSIVFHFNGIEYSKLGELLNTIATDLLKLHQYTGFMVPYDPRYHLRSSRTEGGIYPADSSVPFAPRLPGGILPSAVGGETENQLLLRDEPSFLTSSILALAKDDTFQRVATENDDNNKKTIGDLTAKKPNTPLLQPQNTEETKEKRIEKENENENENEEEKGKEKEEGENILPIARGLTEDLIANGTLPGSPPDPNWNYFDLARSTSLNSNQFEGENLPDLGEGDLAFLRENSMRYFSDEDGL